MSDSENVLDLTADGVQFAIWRTGVENDELNLVSLSLTKERTLTATFVSEQKQAEVTFTFLDARAFRVVDEGGLLELWGASKDKPRPAQTTFRSAVTCGSLRAHSLGSMEQVSPSSAT